MARNESNQNAADNFAVLDIETDPFKKGRMEIAPFCAGFYDGKLLQTFWGADCIQQLIALCRKTKKKIIYAHNGGNFDFHFLLEHLPVADCKFLCIGKRIVQIKTPWGFEFRDSFAIIPKALAAYHKTKISYRHFERGVREKYRKQILDYLGDDLRDLFKMVSGFMARFPAELTLASATFKLLQKEFGADTGRSTAEYDAMLRPFYFAGRVQFWRLGAVPFPCATVDINSAFPWAMTKPHAHGFEFKVGTKIPKRNAEQSFFVVTCDGGGELPWRKPDGGVDFPFGEKDFFVTGWELLAALEVGAVKNLKIHQVLTPKETRDFARFVNHFYKAKVDAKRRGDKEEEFFNKIVLNGGYGKLALNPRRFSEVAVTGIYDTPPDVDGKTKKKRKANAALAGWSVQWDDTERGLTFHSRPSYREGIDKFVNVATAASITGCVRAFLIRSKAKCKNVVYCDTDSLTAGDVSALKMSDALGDWKLEMTYPKNGFHIAGKKLYAGLGRKPGKAEKEWKTASKGVRLSPQKIVAVAKGAERTHVSQAPTFSVFSPPRFVRRTVRRADAME